jgi:hypothetical protein
VPPLVKSASKRFNSCWVRHSPSTPLQTCAPPGHLLDLGHVQFYGGHELVDGGTTKGGIFAFPILKPERSTMLHPLWLGRRPDG